VIPLRSLRALTPAILPLPLCAALAPAGDLHLATAAVAVVTLGAAAAFTLIVRRRTLRQADRLADDARNITGVLAHELRTPLARLRNELSLVAHDPGAEPVRARLEEVQAQADALLTLFSSLLRIAEVDSGVRRENFAAIDLAELVRDCADMMEAAVEESGHRLIPPSLEPIAVAGDRQLLSQMVINLVENVVRHTAAGTEIRIMLSGSDQRWSKLVVQDDGPGIAPADRARALDRFGRLSGGGEKGHGLGLPLVAAIARLHGGSIELGDAQPGLKVTILLPTP